MLTPYQNADLEEIAEGWGVPPATAVEGVPRRGDGWRSEAEAEACEDHLGSMVITSASPPVRPGRGLAVGRCWVRGHWRIPNDRDLQTERVDH